MAFGVLNAAMLAGLLGVAVPIVIHFLNRRRDVVIDWGAMQFLDIGRRARQKLRITELLLMLARMAVLAVVALALARPFWGGSGMSISASSSPARDLVIVLDGSSSMNRSLGETTPRALAIAAAKSLVTGLKPGDSVALLVASDRVRPLLNPPTFDLSKVVESLSNLRSSAPILHSSDLPAALAEAFRILERTQNPTREVVILSDDQRVAWRPGDTGRWALLRDIHTRMPVAPRVWSLVFGKGLKADAPNGSLGPVSVSRALVIPGLPLTVSTEVRNAGPGPLSRSAELLIDGRPTPGTSQTFGPLPEGGRAPLTFKTSLPSAGSHLLTVKLVGGDDSLPDDDEASIAIEAAQALPVLIVDGEPGFEPFTGEADFLRAALAPSGDDTPQVKATVVSPEHFKTSSLQGQSVLMLANVERLDLDQAAAVVRFLESGGGVLVAPGDRTDLPHFNTLTWMPATLGTRTGDFAATRAVAHPAPASFSGAVLSPFARGDSPALAGADLFAYFRLEPSTGASVSTRLDTGEPWAVEKSPGKGRVLLLSGPLDAEGGTLPVNPDFVPLVHEWSFHLAAGSEPKAVKPGEPLVFELNPAPEATVSSLPIQTPDGAAAKAIVTRNAGIARARFDDTAEAGVYRLALPDPPGGFSYATVIPDPRESEPDLLDQAEAARLSEGWPLRFETDPAKLTLDLLSAGSKPRRELWRYLVLAALAGLCVEIYLTRRLVRGQGLTSS